MNYERFAKQLETINKTVYTEPSMQWSENISDVSFNRFIKNGSFKDVLDVGFGTGYGLNKFKAQGLNVTGISLSQEEVASMGFMGHNVKLMDMNFLDFDDASFDLLWCRQTLEHSVMPTIALMEFYRVLRPNGHLYVEVPSDSTIHVANKNHYSVLGDGMWQSLLKRVGFHLIFVTQLQVVMQFGEDDFTDIYWVYWLKKSGV